MQLIDSENSMAIEEVPSSLSKEVDVGQLWPNYLSWYSGGWFEHESLVYRDQTGGLHARFEFDRPITESYTCQDLTPC